VLLSVVPPLLAGFPPLLALGLPPLALPPVIPISAPPEAMELPPEPGCCESEDDPEPHIAADNTRQMPVIEATSLFIPLRPSVRARLS
jgi:hypothetical protein